MLPVAALVCGSPRSSKDGLLSYWMAVSASLTGPASASLTWPTQPPVNPVHHVKVFVFYLFHRNHDRTFKGMVFKLINCCDNNLD